MFASAASSWRQRCGMLIHMALRGCQAQSSLPRVHCRVHKSLAQPRSECVVVHSLTVAWRARALSCSTQAGLLKARRGHALLNSTAEQDWSTMQKLIYHKAGSIVAEFDALLQDPASDSDDPWALVWQHTQGDPDSMCEARAACIQLLLEASADFHKRFTLRLQSLPLTLLWLVRQPPGTPCAKRKEVAGQLLATLDDDVFHDSTEFKIASTLQPWLQASKSTGRLDPRIHEMFTYIAHLLPADTQEIEGMNSIIKRTMTIAPGIGLELLNTRTLLKKHLHHRQEGAFLPPERLQDEVSKCLENHSAAMSALTDRE
eukprot:1146270-Alexandrium_andersonii.AAC.1